MLATVIGAAFCCVPLAVLFGHFAPARRPSQQWAANDNLCPRERLAKGSTLSLLARS